MKTESEVLSSEARAPERRGNPDVPEARVTGQQAATGKTKDIGQP